LAVPLIRASEAIGAISIRRTEVRPFIDQQIDLLKTCAEQAAIAIENVRFARLIAITREGSTPFAGRTIKLRYP